MRVIKGYNEDVYGNYATVFHRTKIDNIVNFMYTEGFKPGDSCAYGKGFYSTYDLLSQDRPNMLSYGSIVLKVAVPLDKFVIFDWEPFLKTPLAKRQKVDKENFIQLQCARLNIVPTNSLFDWSTAVALLDRFTSDCALYLKRMTDIEDKANGLVFTTRTDGRVLVSYNTDILIPLAIRKDENAEFTKVSSDKKYLAKALKAKIAFI